MAADLPRASELALWRAEKDRFLREHRNSPLYGAAAFEGLDYYPEADAYRVEATVARPASSETVLLTTSSGEERLYVVYGTATFELAGERQSLALFAPPDAPDGPRLFVPFKDATSGADTYGAGRYLELQVTAPDRQVIDFNYAYHPYCAYAEGYSCPFPPPQNRLSVPVRAGERLPGAPAAP